MKRILPTTQYVFNVSGNLIDFSTYPDFDPKRLLAVINTTTGQTLIYAVGGGPSSSTAGTFNGSLGSYYLNLNFNTNTAGMSDSDILQIIYDESVGTEEAKASIDIVSGKAGLDVNLLNSSFGGTLDDVMPAPFQDNALSIAVLNGGILSAPAMNVNNELIIDATQSGPIPVNGSVTVSGALSVDNFPATQPVTGTFFQATQPVSATALPLPTNASTSALQTTGNTSLSSVDGKLTTLNAKDFSTSALQTSGNAILTSIDSKTTAINNKTPVLGANVIAASVPVTIAADQIVAISSPDLFVTGQSAQTAIVNNIIPAASSILATEVFGYRSVAIQVVCTGTGGTFIFEGSNDNVNFQTIPVFNQALLSGAAIISAISAAVSQTVYVFPTQTRYIRLRIVTTITGGSIQAFSRISQTNFAPATNLVSQAAGGNLNVTAAVTGSLTSVASVNSAILSSSVVTDIASAAITTTTTSASLSNSLAQSMTLMVNVSAVSGTNPTLDIVLQESFDSGSTFYDIYHFPRILSTGQYFTPLLKLGGVNYRIVRTVGGTTPSFTMSAIRTNKQIGTGYVKSFINRTIDPNILGSNSSSCIVDGCDKIQLCVSMGAGGTTPTFKLQGSEDLVTFYDLGATTLAVAASSSGAATYNGFLPKFVRAQVTVAGVGATLSQLCIKGTGV